MRLSLGEIKNNAITFAHDWADVAGERAEAQSFWNDFFKVFGISRRSVSSFEEKVRNLKGAYDRIDVFYSGVMIGEHKPRGSDLSKAATQAFDYIQSLTREGRTDEIPRYIVISDFDRIVLYDLDAKDPAGTPIADFKTKKLHENIRHFSFLSGYQTRPVDPEDPINIRAVEILGALHDELEKGGYNGHPLERFLVRILFCLFADDTGIFEPDAFKSLVEGTRTDGADLGSALARLFEVLDTPADKRRSNLPEELQPFPCVNGRLFHEKLPFADFTKGMRSALLHCCNFRWAQISPAVFGSLFQSIMSSDEGNKKRRQIGAHYTSERDILKLIRSLFLDELHEEFNSILPHATDSLKQSVAPRLTNSQKSRLTALLDKLASLKFLDPACGCGNFLVIAYRELRLLELAIIQTLHGRGDIQRVLDLDHLLRINVDQMHGIEIEEWPARIAEVAMWLIDHQMNLLAAETFGVPFFRLPLTRSARIECANALRIDWNTVLPAKDCSYVMGNPPFVGKKEQSPEQRGDMDRVWGDIKGAGLLDYVTCWYLIAARYMRGTDIAAAFVSTNSICQGEQVGILWRELLVVRGLSIRFAHNTFAWMSEARGKAHVHVVIIGFGQPAARPHLWDYGEDEERPTRADVRHLSAYLIDGPDVLIVNRTRPISNTAELNYGSFALDDGHYTLSPDEMKSLLSAEPRAAPFIRRFIGAQELIRGEDRFCLWLIDATPAQLRSLPSVLERVEAVHRWRAGRGRETTRLLAETPTLFAEMRQPQTDYVAIPTVSSEGRRYIPIAFLPSSVIASNQIYVLPSATRYHFGVLTSEMHMAWVRQVCGRLESRYRYSNKLVYNNFPWPESATDKQKAAVEEAAQAVLDARQPFLDKGDTLADLYDPLAMPKTLRDAHRDLDCAVDRCYRPQPFPSERARVEYLFNLYQQLTAPLAPTTQKNQNAPATNNPSPPSPP